MTDTENANAQRPTDAQSDRVADVILYLHWGALAGFSLLAVLATLQFYASGSRAIEIWISAEYQPLFEAVFNLAILLVSGIGISIVVRRLTETD